MPRPKRPLADADVNVGVPPKNNARKARKTEHSSAADTKYAQVNIPPENEAPPGTSAVSHAKAPKGKVPDYKTWICLCKRSAYGSVSTEEEQEDSSEDSDTDDAGAEREPRHTRAAPEVCDGGKTCLCLKLASGYPQHKEVVTKKGYDLYVKWTLELENRDQDVHHDYQGNDYNGYGAVEVVENIILAFHHEYQKKRLNVRMMWSQLEGFALFTKQLRNHPAFNMLDDSERLAKLVMLTGTLILTSVWLLVTKNQLDTRRSQLRNISMIYGFFLEYAYSMRERCKDNEAGWKHMLVKICKGDNVFESGLWDNPNIMKAVSKSLEEAAEHALEDDSDLESDANKPEDEVPNRCKAYEGETRSWKVWDFGYVRG